jgi:cell division protein FtsI (penicillin-binding protein 3)
MKIKRRNSREPELPGITSPTKAPRSRRLATPHEQALDIAHNRCIAAMMLFAAAFLVIAGRLTFLSLLSEPPDVQQTMHATTSESVTQRADITDRNGVLLATSLPTMSLCADAKKIIDPAAAIKQLIVVLPELDTVRLKNDLNSDKHCVMVKRHLTPKQYYEVNKLGIAGLDFLPDERRIYPAGNVTAHVIGYTDIDDNGLAGAEKNFDAKLQQQDEPVALSFDLRVQNIMRNELVSAENNFHAIGAAGLVMDVKTGEILALVSLPDFDPQHAGNASDDARFNRDTLGVYEMGSTFKIFNTALALDSGLIHVSDSFDTTHPVEVGHQFIKDFHPENRWLNVAEIFTHSSNIGSARMVERLGAQRQRAFFAKLGLTERMPLEIPETGAPLIPPARDWNEATMLTASFGHGIAVNAVQLAGAVATIINDGHTVHPTLLKATGPVVAKGDPVVSEHTSAIIRALMRLVVTRGTAKSADVPGYLIGGKTGTSDKIGANHHYETNARLSSFIGAFPLNAPRYLVFAMLDDPKGNAKTYGFATGGWTAAPVVNRVVSQIGPLLDIAPLTNETETAAEQKLLKPLGSQIVDGMPVGDGSNYAAAESDSVE